MTAVRGHDPGIAYNAITADLGEPFYARIDAPANAAQKKILKNAAPGDIALTTLAGEKVTASLTTAPGNDAAFGGLKITTQNGWFAARPSGTEDVYKIYAESFVSEAHLRQIQGEAQAAVARLFAAGGA
jgi:phosphoglucomutase